METEVAPKVLQLRSVNPIDFLTEAERVTLTARAVDMRDAILMDVPLNGTQGLAVQAILMTELALTLLRQRGVNEPKPETAIAAAVRKINENRPLPAPGAPGVPHMGGGPADLMPSGATDRIVEAAGDLVRMAKAAELAVQECQGSKVPDVRATCNAIAEKAAMIPVYAGGTKLRIES